MAELVDSALLLGYFKDENAVHNYFSPLTYPFHNHYRIGQSVGWAKAHLGPCPWLELGFRKGLLGELCRMLKNRLVKGNSQFHKNTLYAPLGCARIKSNIIHV